MRIAASLAVAFAALTAATDVRAEGRDCEVVFVRAPDEVRLVIESWLKAEPRCSGTIELRVVETETGSLYLIAQRPDGRIHEREVPDAQSAGVLVASWVADDWTSTRPEDEEPPPPAVEPVTVNPFEGAPGVTATMPPMPPPDAPRATGRWFSVTGMTMIEGMGGFGGRFEMDLFGGHGSKWTLGAALVGVSSLMHIVTADGFGNLDTTDLRALLVAARTWRVGDNWNIRWSVGLGPMYTDASAHMTGGIPIEGMEYIAADGVSAAYETTLTLARELFDHRWAITAGFDATIISQELDSNADVAVARNTMDMMFIFGARYRL